MNAYVYSQYCDCLEIGARFHKYSQHRNMLLGPQEYPGPSSPDIAVSLGVVEP
jgi:hypothetical protein